jgi:ribonuclease J
MLLFELADREDKRFQPAADLYAADVARATGRATIPQAEWPEVRVFLPESQLRKVNATREFARTKRILEHRIQASEIARQPNAYTLLFRREMGDGLEKAECLHGARALWSQSTFYLASSREARWLAEKRIPLVAEHTSGHATASDLQRIAGAFAPARIVPIHTDAPELFAASFANVELHADGEWWEV